MSEEARNLRFLDTKTAPIRLEDDDFDYRIEFDSSKDELTIIFKNNPMVMSKLMVRMLIESLRDIVGQ